MYGAVAREYGTNFITNAINPDDVGYINQHGLSRKHIFESVKHSLERLQLDYVDVLQCEFCTEVSSSFLLIKICYLLGHRFDNTTPIEETVITMFSFKRPMLKAV